VRATAAQMSAHCLTVCMRVTIPCLLPLHEARSWPHVRSVLSAGSHRGRVPGSILTAGIYVMWLRYDDQARPVLAPLPSSAREADRALPFQACPVL